MRLIITPMGGCGSVFMGSILPMSVKRPDVVLCKGYPKIVDLRLDIDRYPEKLTEQMIAHWSQRAGADLDRRATIGENLMEVFLSRKACRCNRWALLSGVCSTVHPFLTRNKLKAVCLVRHPLHSYVSFFKHRHPNHAVRFGGFDTIGAISYWAELWNKIVEDFLSSGNKISRYEFWPEDSGNQIIQSKFVGRWTHGKRNWGELPKNLEEALRKRVWANFLKIYGDNWGL